MKYNFERNPLYIILSIVFSLIGLCALISAFMLIEYVFNDYFALGVILLVAIVFGIGFLIAHLMDKRSEKKQSKNEIKVHNVVTHIPDELIERLENEATALAAMISSAEALPSLADISYSSYLKGMGVVDTPYNRMQLRILSNKLVNIMNKKQEMSTGDYKRILFKAYQDNMAFFK